MSTFLYHRIRKLVFFHQFVSHPCSALLTHHQIIATFYCIITCHSFYFCLSFWFILLRVVTISVAFLVVNLPTYTFQDSSFLLACLLVILHSTLSKKFTSEILCQIFQILIKNDVVSHCENKIIANPRPY